MTHNLQLLTVIIAFYTKRDMKHIYNRVQKKNALYFSAKAGGDCSNCCALNI